VVTSQAALVWINVQQKLHIKKFLPEFAARVHSAHWGTALFRGLGAAAVLTFFVATLATTALRAEDPRRGDRKPQEAVEPFYGSFDQSVRIEVPAFHGIEPSLALTYGSSRGNGMLGVGWRLGGLSVIEAATPRRGTPKYNSNDIFLMDRHELVACLPAMTSPSCTTGGTHAGKTENYLRIKLNSVNNLWEVWNRRGVKITYRAVLGPNTQNFATTYRWAIAEVVDPHGNTVTYTYWTGDDAYPDLVTYNSNEIEFFWEDRPDPFDHAIGSGNMVRTDQRLKSIDVRTGAERVRAYALTYAPQSPGTSRSLLQGVQLFGRDATVDAAGNVSGPSALPPTTFDYFDNATTFAASTTWSSAHANATYSKDQVHFADVTGDARADRIFRTSANNIYVSVSNGVGFDAPLLWASPGGTHKTDQDAYADVDGDGKADLIFRKSDNKIGVYLSTGTSFQAPASWRNMGGTYYSGQAQYGDVNGDGMADLVFREVSTPCDTVTLSSGSWCGSIPPYPNCPSGYSNISQWVTETPNACGKDLDQSRYQSFRKCQHCDLIENIHVAYSNGTKFAAPNLALSNLEVLGGAYEADRLKLADVNGDGMVDVSFRGSNNKIWIALANGSGSGFSALSHWFTLSSTYQPCQLQFADVNGDGTADLIFRAVSTSCTSATVMRPGWTCGFVAGEYPACPSGYTEINNWTTTTGSWCHDPELPKTLYYTECQDCNNTQGIQVSLSTGSSFTGATLWYPGLYGNNGNYEYDQVKLADLNDDGRADLTFRGAGNAVTVALSNGAAFEFSTTLSGFGGGYASEQIQLADVNGDGRDDVVHRSTGQVVSVALAGPVGQPADDMSTVTNAFGGTTTAAYTPSSAWNNVNLPFVVHTIASVTTDDGRGQSATSTYSYEGGKWDAGERRFLGFRTATVTQPCIAAEVNCPITRITFAQELASVGEPEQIEWLDGAGDPMRKVVEEYSLNGATVPRTSLNTASWAYVYDTSVPGSGRPFRKTKVTRIFDAFANVVERTHLGDEDVPGDEVSTQIEFVPNTTDYIVGLPAAERHFAGVGTAGAKLSETLIHYDGAAASTTPPTDGDPTLIRAWDDANAGYVDTTAEYDTYGNRTATVDPLGRRTEVDYDSVFNLYPRRPAKSALLRRRRPPSDRHHLGHDLRPTAERDRPERPSHATPVRRLLPPDPHRQPGWQLRHHQLR